MWLFLYDPFTTNKALSGPFYPMTPPVGEFGGGVHQLWSTIILVGPSTCVEKFLSQLRTQTDAGLQCHYHTLMPSIIKNNTYSQHVLSWDHISAGRPHLSKHYRSSLGSAQNEVLCYVLYKMDKRIRWGMQKNWELATGARNKYTLRVKKNPTAVTLSNNSDKLLL